MDAEGARALARRIAEGKPDAEDPEKAAPETPSPAQAEDGVVLVRPLATERPHKVWIYVRGVDGHLRRAD